MLSSLMFHSVHTYLEACKRTVNKLHYLQDKNCPMTLQALSEQACITGVILT